MNKSTISYILKDFFDIIIEKFLAKKLDFQIQS